MIFISLMKKNEANRKAFQKGIWIWFENSCKNIQCKILKSGKLILFMKEINVFTGIIEEIGIIKNIKPIAQAKRITIQSKKVIKNLNVDDSISVNGVCLTVVSVVSEFI